ncbi:uncharacterized protein MONBRDRAFT_26966 [Monosiga brevicollis MX1]|uniref:Uncharacterized protein n=1 Tax=Monosiga brevicollis TaxID=81824 RepID=A9V3G3_MONBE|nr:uncharacterized protein MONBRDRAFT_26966 [Monosiga brevicollis MX1]EDQ87907.1 predicted protein [Monosiga brevicollis MX1]|eukprot:XP_001747440.1 hypothetical protein [Monosiga brevicollis MX1]
MATAVTGQKRAAPVTERDDTEDILSIMPLGAGQEVGRSCHIITYKGFTIMLDCGTHPAKSGLAQLPYVDEVDLSQVDFCFVTHFHVDHCGALPWLLSKTPFKGRVFMTHATKAVYQWMLTDYVRINATTDDNQLFSDKDIENTMKRIETVDFEQTVMLRGLSFTPYSAGHVLGACMFEIDIAGVKLLYTGDFSRDEDRHLMAASIPPIKPDILIAESTLGDLEHENRQDRERRFTKEVHTIVQRGGRCLIPVFALGRAQELLLILDEYWQQHPELHNVPIYYASALAKRCMGVFKAFVNMMNPKIQQQMKISNPFQFQFIHNLRKLDEFDDHGSSVVLATPGMLQNGLSRELFERWAPNRHNGVILAGYHVEGTLAHELLKQPRQIRSMAGGTVPRNCTIANISFNAHVDSIQNRDFIGELEPQHLVLVHGQESQMRKLKESVLKDFEQRDRLISVYNPKNTEKQLFHYRGEKNAKVLGKLAREFAAGSRRISGVLVSKAFDYKIMHPDELAEFTQLRVARIRQRQTLPFQYDLRLLKVMLEQFMGCIGVSHQADAKTIRLEWDASPESDMWAEAIISAALQVEASPATIRLASAQLKHAKEVESNTSQASTLCRLLSDYFGSSTVVRDSDSTLRVTVDQAVATISMPSFRMKPPSQKKRSNLKNSNL